MSGSHLRRSSRRREKQEKFTVGMIVEINRNRIHSKGRLVSKLTDEASSNPRWLVAFDEESWPEEDIYESYFGKIIETVSDTEDKARNSIKTGKEIKKGAPSSATTSSSSGPAPDNTGQSRQKKKSAKSPPTTPPEPTKSSSDKAEEDSVSSHGKKRKTTDTDEEGKLSDDSAARKKAQDREARRKRRQAIVEEEEMKMGIHDHVVGSAIKKKTKGEDVIEVPMLTGTLLIYRGIHRRAEFIYKK